MRGAKMKFLSVQYSKKLDESDFNQKILKNINFYVTNLIAFELLL